MPTIRNGYVVCSRATVKSHGRWSQKQRKYKDWFRGTFHTKYHSAIGMGTIQVPKEYVGKKIKLKVEVIE